MMGSTVIQSTGGWSFCTPASARWIRSVQRPPIVVRIIAPSTIPGPRIVFPCGNLAQRSDRPGRKIRIVRQRGSVLYRRRWRVSLVRRRRSKIVVVIPRRMWRVSVTLPRRRGRPLSSWGIRLLLLRPTTSMVERPTRTRRGWPLMRPLMRRGRRTVPKSIRMWRMRVEILRRMRVVVIIIRWVLSLLLLWWHLRWRVTLHRRPTWSGSSSWTTWTTTSPVHVMMIGVPRRPGLVWRTSAPVVEVSVTTRWWMLGVSRRIIHVLGWHRRSDRDGRMMASALVKFVRGFVRGHSLKNKKKKSQANYGTPRG